MRKNRPRSEVLPEIVDDTVRLLERNLQEAKSGLELVKELQGQLFAKLSFLDSLVKLVDYQVRLNYELFGEEKGGSRLPPLVAEATKLMVEVGKLEASVNFQKSQSQLKKS